ncbi:hypothetical protein QYE76_042190 [Lolium multiflorum]|uniref:Uncharacterized protein n=1 Tax=Lolium multiflorum TaxID=4521 RepID=A0AAD8TGA8_LOLMU|nr:hypothetical protein QYE76_042190 [Lolium multiflorum]
MTAESTMEEVLASGDVANVHILGVVGDRWRDIPVEIQSAGRALARPSTSALPSCSRPMFLYMLCSFKYATYIYKVAWVTFMTAFVVAFLPESIGVPLEAMSAPSGCGIGIGDASYGR